MRTILGLVAALAVAPAAWSSDFGPWRFGMSKDKVRSCKDLGPYRSFSNGDLETLDAAMQKCQYAHDVFAERYGEIEMPGGLPASNDGRPSREEVQADVRARLAAGQKVQMAPVTQPRELLTYSSSWTAVVEGATYYYVVINADRPHGSR